MHNGNYCILTINLGSTSSSAYVFYGEEEVLAVDLAHTVEELAQHPELEDEAAFRREQLMQAIRDGGIDLAEIDGIAAGGIGRYGKYYGGAYEINELLAEDAKKAAHRGLANGPVIAWALSQELGVPAYLYDVFKIGRAHV